MSASARNKKNTNLEILRDIADDDFHRSLWVKVGILDENSGAVEFVHEELNWQMTPLSVSKVA